LGTAKESREGESYQSAIVLKRGKKKLRSIRRARKKRKRGPSTVLQKRWTGTWSPEKGEREATLAKALSHLGKKEKEHIVPGNTIGGGKKNKNNENYVHF